MYVNEKLIPTETVTGIREEGMGDRSVCVWGGQKFKYVIFNTL
jgi:hypothetical protein